MKTAHAHPPRTQPSEAGRERAITRPTKTPQRAQVASKPTSTGKANAAGATFPQAYAAPSLREALVSRNVAGMSVDAGQALAPSEASPVRLRHRLGGMG